MTESIDDLEAELTTLENDPGNRVFADTAEKLRLRGKPDAALGICLAGLSANPDFHRGRLILAQIFYEMGFIPFAAREVRELARKLPENQDLRKLLEKLEPGSSAELAAAESNSAVETVAEAEFDIDIIEGLDSEKNG